jgi:gliding motility-associated lipoprotein GldD
MKNFLLCGIIVSLFSACGANESSDIPRPKGYYRIAFPKHAYVLYKDSCPFNFEHPIYSQIMYRNNYRSKCWPDVYFPQFKASVHLSYSQVNDNLEQILEDSRTLTYKHTVKANDIAEQYIQFPDKRVFGTLYSVSGNAASAIQFHLTDSSRHFIRGSLYFNASPNSDSLAPVINFLSKDVEHLIQTLNWK